VTNCTLCRNTGWLIEAKTIKGSTTLEIIPCLIPDCPYSGMVVELMSIDYMRFRKAALHPTEGYIMSVLGR